MMSVADRDLAFAVITPARNEESNLRRLADALAAQTRVPERWIIVENGSTDGTLALCHELEREYPWISVLESEGTGAPVRGAPIVRAINAGLRQLDGSIDVVVNVDADVSMAPEYFETLLWHFAADPSLGIASGSAYELDASDWRQRHVTGGTVWGATRAYRRACLDQISPLEERHGWDGLDQLAARAQGWTTKTLVDLQFLHHRAEGERDGSRWSHWQTCGDTAHYMGYRSWYLVMRALHQSRKEVAALALISGYASAALRRAPRWQNDAGRRVLRDDQSLGNLRQRRREAVGRALPSAPRPAGTDSS
jgi:poly-beta-1,6-N-acetyl-D-glucosamine synthase